MNPREIKHRTRRRGLLLVVFGSQLGCWLVSLAWSVYVGGKVLEGADQDGRLVLWSGWKHQTGELGWEGNSGTLTSYAFITLADAETTNVRLDCVAGMCHCRKRFRHTLVENKWTEDMQVFYFDFQISANDLVCSSLFLLFRKLLKKALLFLQNWRTKRYDAFIWLIWKQALYFFLIFSFAVPMTCVVTVQIYY